MRLRQPKRKCTNSPPGGDTDDTTKRVCPEDNDQSVALDDARDSIMEVEHLQVQHDNVHPFVKMVTALWYTMS